MINLGGHPGKGWPDYYIPRQVVDYVLEGISIVLLVIAWGTYIVHLLLEKPLESTTWMPMGVLTFVIVLFLLLPNRVSTKRYNFPVQIREGNIVNQLFIAHRFMRTLVVILSISLFTVILDLNPNLLPLELSFYSEIIPGIPFLLIPVLIIYFIIAYRYR